MSKWIKTTHPGVRFREHPSRKYNRQKDKYFEIRYQRNGKSCGEALGWLSDGMTPLEASRVRGEILQNIKKGISPQSVAEMRQIKETAVQEELEQKMADEKKNITFGEAAEKYLKWSDNNKRSSAADRNRYDKHLEPRFKDMPLRDISPFHLEKLKSSLKKSGLAPATVTQCLQLVRTIYRKSREWGLYDGAPPKTKFPKLSNKRAAFLTADQAKKLLEALKGRSLQLWCQTILGLYAGLRFGEIAGLEFRDIDPEAGTIHLRDPKSGDDRFAYITPPIREMFDEWQAFNGRRQGLVFPDRNGKRQARVSNVFYRVADELKFNEGCTDARQRIVFHSLRHTFASWLVMSGESVQTIKELMGHRDVQTTMRYSHLAPDIKRNAVHNLVAALNNQGDEKLVANLSVVK